MTDNSPTWRTQHKIPKKAYEFQSMKGTIFLNDKVKINLISPLQEEYTDIKYYVYSSVF